MTDPSSAEPAPVDRPTVRIGPADLHPITESELVEHVRSRWGSGGSVVTPNVDILYAAGRDPALAGLISEASLVVADGMPLVWASRIAGRPLPARVTGSSLVGSLSAAAAADGRGVFVLGGEPGVPEAAAEALAARHPGLRVVGTFSPPWGFEDSADGRAEVVARVAEAAPDLVLVGLGFPKQERAIRELREALPGAWYLGCGAGIAMAAGQFRRAPDAMQKSGLEWVFRLLLEPRRLARRYLRNDLWFALGLLLRAAATRVRGVLRPARTDAPGYICFAAQDWWYHNRAHSDFQLMRTLARDQRVLVVNSIGMRMPTRGNSTQVARKIIRKLRSLAKLVRRPLPELPNFHVMSPVPLPFYGSALLRRVNAVLVRLQVILVARALGLREPVIIATLPTAGDVARPMRRRSLIFNRSDRHSDFVESDRDVIREMELALLAESDHVLYVSRALLAEEQPHAGARAYFLDHGVDLEHFRAVGPERLPADLSAIPGPRIGFFGALDELVVDFDLLERLAKELPDASLVLIGDSSHDMERFVPYPNVHWLGFRPYTEIPAYGSGFDVAIMPWVQSSWIAHCNPIKLKEYLALGLPVVSTDFAEVEHYREHVRVAADAGEFVEMVRGTLADRGPTVPEQRRSAVLGHSWRSRAELVEKLVAGS